MDQITIQLNGRVCITKANSIQALIRQNGFQDTHVLVEHNGQVLCKSVYKTTSICPGDSIEIIRYIGGGKTL